MANMDNGYASKSAKQKSFESAQAKALLNSMPYEIREKFLKGYLHGDYKGIKDVTDYFIDNSEMSRLAMGNPGSASIFEFLYRKKTPWNPIDSYIVMSNIGTGIYKRLIALIENMPRLILAEHASCGEKILVDNIGSGPGHDMIDTLYKNPQLASIVHVRNIEPDGSALEIGRTRVESLRLSDSFSFVNKKTPNDLQWRYIPE